MHNPFFKKIHIFKVFKYKIIVSNFSTIKTLPFNISREQVNKILVDKSSIFQKSIDKNRIQAKIISPQYKGDPIKKFFLPFYSANVIGLWSKYEGQYGVDKTQYYSHYNVIEKKWETKTRTVTDWYSISGSICPTDYPLGTKKTQIYAGFEYPRHYIENALETKDLNHLKQKSVSQTINAKVCDHQMKMSFAVEKIIASLHKLQQQRISQHIKKQRNADHVTISMIDMVLNDSKIDYHSFHLPAYVYHFNNDNSQLFKCISGYDGKHDGQRVYSPFKVGLAGGISGIGLTILTILFSANPFVLAGGTLARLGMIGAISSVISGLIAKYGSLYKYNKYRSQLKDQIKYNQTKAAQSDEDFFQKQKQQKQKFNQNYKSDEKKQQNHKQSKKTFTGQDSKTQNKYGFMNKYPEDQCRLLGLNPRQNISIEMLKTARNKKIKQWHPDRFKGNNELANEMCGRINNAYDLLKNLIEQK